MEFQNGVISVYKIFSRVKCSQKVPGWGLHNNLNIMLFSRTDKWQNLAWNRFSWVEFSKTHSPELNTDEAFVFIAGTETFSATTEPRNHNLCSFYQNHPEITQICTFVALIRLSTITHNLFTLNTSHISWNNQEKLTTGFWQINTSRRFSYTRLIQAPLCH